MTFLENIKAIPITDLARRMGFLVVRKGRYYSLREHDSVIIDMQKNCFWRNSRFSQGFKGGAGSSIDFVMEFGDETDYKRAMRRLALMYGIEGGSPSQPQQLKSDHKEPSIPLKEQPIGKKAISLQIQLPPKGKKSDKVFCYLLGRGISATVIKYFIDRQMLYQDNRENCVFVSPLQDFACVRSTGNRRFLKDCEGSNYEHCFFFKGKDNAKRLVVAESVIDVMSYMTYLQIQGEWFGNYAYLALAGTNKISSLFVHLQRERIQEVFLCLDRDKAGEDADRKAINGMRNMNFKGVWHIEKPFNPEYKDWNDYIKSFL